MTGSGSRSSQQLRILLMGLMGAGKSTIGSAVAAALGCPYLDNDRLLAEHEGASTVELAARGSDVLHAAESRQLRALLDVPGPWVAGAAGSLGDRQDDCDLVRRSLFTVYLHASPATLARRLAVGPERPWLRDDPQATIEDMYRRRDAAFLAAASLVVDAESSVDDTVARIVHAVDREGLPRQDGPS